MMNEKKYMKKYIHSLIQIHINDTQDSLMHTHITEYTYTYHFIEKTQYILLIMNYNKSNELCCFTSI